jgi:membrane-bound lytic murein transglycosylase A
MRRVATAGIAATMLAGLAGCKLPADTGAGGNPDARYEAVSFKALPGWSPARAEAGLAAFVRSCKVIEVMPIDQALGGAGIAARRAGRAGDWRAACAAARAVPPADPQAAEAFFEKTFQPYAAAGSTHFTGYYEPVYPASKTRRRGYEVPLYGMPSDLVTASPAVFGGGGKAAGTSATSKHHAGKQVVGRIVYGKLVPYYTRAEIADGALGRDAPVIAWLRSPAARYMLQIQGSGQLDLRHGKHVTVGFAGTNGRPYTPIGRVMVQQGDLREDDVNAGTIAGYLRAHPKRARALMDANENFVFFKRVVDVPEGLGAPGALGVPLTGGHALAVDRAAIPLGAPVYLAAGDARHAAGFDRLAVAQDLDVAAHGTGAAQLFTGLGPGGERRAAATDFDGRLYLLLPRPQPVASDAAKGGVS